MSSFITCLLGLCCLVLVVTPCAPPIDIDFSKLDKTEVYAQYVQPLETPTPYKCYKLKFAIDESGTSGTLNIDTRVGDELKNSVSTVTPDGAGGLNLSMDFLDNGKMINLFNNDDGFVGKLTLTIAGGTTGSESNVIEAFAVVSKTKEISEDKVNKLLEGACVTKENGQMINQSDC